MPVRIFLLIGSAGAGKNTLINCLLQPQSQLVYIPSFTTRDPRPGESEANPYHFISKVDFAQRITENEFFEYQEVHGNLYGTSKKEFRKIITNNQIGITDVDILGGLKIKHAWPELVTTIFIRPSDPDVLVERLELRHSESQETLERRLKRVPLEISMENQCDYVVINDDLEQAVDSLIKIVLL
ncbi:guanylate kinase [Peptococcaceae bacterium CEB3]|nr:guanylate kinase [Peptococcaceae bacterium CEB3]